MAEQQLKIVSATRLDRDAFWKQTLLGQSLSLFPQPLLPLLDISFDNVDGEGEDGVQRLALGLPTIYNRAIATTSPDVDLLFVHDDVFIHDIFVKERLTEAFRRFDIVGLAGSRQSNLNDPSWALEFNPDTLDPIGWQKATVFSGAVSHGHFSASGPPEPMLGLYGKTPDFCTLLDGLFLGVKTSAIGQKHLRFDDRFRFHCYDIDFSRQATDAGLLLGTWPILVTHGSGGDFGAPAFKAAARQYLAKWNARDFERQLGVEPPALENRSA